MNVRKEEVRIDRIASGTLFLCKQYLPEGCLFMNIKEEETKLNFRVVALYGDCCGHSAGSTAYFDHTEPIQVFTCGE